MKPGQTQISQETGRRTVPGRRIVLLDMTTEDAEAFVRAMQPDSVMSGFDVGMLEGKATVEAVVARPVVWCKCDVVPETRSGRRARLKRRESGWSRGKNLGWWLCGSCRKPSHAAVMHWITTMLAGANDLLPKILGGEAIAPSMRWKRDGGIPNEHADADHHSAGIVQANDGAVKVRRKPRRSELDRIRAQEGDRHYS